MSEIKAVHLFSSGTEFEIWEHHNCARCVKEPTCDLKDALFTDGLTEGMYQGQGLPETAERLGYSEMEHGGMANWLCKERQTDAAPPTPAATEMKIAGAMPLPGLLDDVPERPAERGGYPS